MKRTNNLNAHRVLDTTEAVIRDTDVDPGFCDVSEKENSLPFDSFCERFLLVG